MVGMALRHVGLRAQIVLSLGALLAVVFSFTGMAVLWALRASIQGQRRDVSEVAARAVIAQVAAEVRGGQPGARRLVALLDRSVGQAGITAVAVHDRSGRLVAAAGRGGRGPDLGSIDVTSASALRVVRATRSGGEEIVLLEPLGSGRGSVAAVVGLSAESEDLARLGRPVLIYLLASGLVLLAFGYVAMSRLIVRPIEVLTAATEKVAAGDLGVMVPIAGGWEIAAAARAFNEMTRRLRDQTDSLAAKVTELEATARELQATQDQLVRSAKLASVGSLAAGVAHEVGNPVSAIIGLSEVLIDGGLEPEEETDYLERIRREAERVSRIVRDLLEYARPSPEDVDGCASVEEAVDAAVGLLSPQKAYREVDIQVIGDAELPHVALDVDQLTQVLVNLMMNAADAVGGEGEVRVRLEPDRLVGPRGGARPAVRISVSDSGPGVPPDRLPRIFEPFYTTKDPGAGTGLGLALCEGIVSRAGGRVSAENLPGGGFMVSIVLPAAEGDEAEGDEG